VAEPTPAPLDGDEPEVATEVVGLLRALPRVKITPGTITQHLIDRWYREKGEYLDEIRDLRKQLAAAIAECDRVTTRADLLDGTLDTMRQQAVEAVKARNAANARAETAKGEAARLTYELERSEAIRKEWHKHDLLRRDRIEDTKAERDRPRARLDGLGDVTDDMVTAAWEAMGWERAPYMARVANFTREQIDNGEFREANDQAEAANDDLMRRTLTAAIEAAPWRPSADGAGTGLSKTAREEGPS
jgi:chromosome segregation ATPase